jgi:hypothetical protein
MYKLLAVITAVGLGLVGLVIWAWFASYPAGPYTNDGARSCTSDHDRDCVRKSRDGSVLLVLPDGTVVRLTAGHG